MSFAGSSVFEKAIGRLDKTIKQSKQYGAADFEFEPVSLDVFVKDKAFLGLPPLGERQREAVEFATQVYFPETMKELGWKQHRYVKEIVLLWGKGSGKDFISRVIHLRIAYLLLCLRNPQAYYFHPDMQVGMEHIHLLNTASTKEQAGNVFFSPLRRYVKNSPFFRTKAQVLTSEIRFEKGIFVYSGHSEAEAHEGLNLIAVVLDEIAAFKTEDEVADMGEFFLLVAKERAADQGVPATTACRRGKVREQIKRAALEQGASLVVLGRPAGSGSAFQLSNLEAFADEIRSETGIETIIV